MYLDRARPLSEPKWVKSGDVQEWLNSMFGRMFWIARDAAGGWEKKIEVVDPDPVSFYLCFHQLEEAWPSDELCAGAYDLDCSGWLGGQFHCWAADGAPSIRTYSYDGGDRPRPRNSPSPCAWRTCNPLHASTRNFGTERLWPPSRCPVSRLSPRFTADARISGCPRGVAHDAGIRTEGASGKGSYRSRRTLGRDHPVPSFAFTL